MTVADKWRKVLKESGYSHDVTCSKDCRKLRKLPRSWRRIFRHTNFKETRDLSAFEVGCGGAIHLARLGLNGWRCVGIDCSEDVLIRAKKFVNKVYTICGKSLDVELFCGDFLEYRSSQKFDLVFNFGVIEHFTDDNERLLVYRKMFDLTKSGGYIVSVVPNGVHPMREKMRVEMLGGYDIPEIDYSCDSLEKELLGCGASDVTIFSHNIFGYLLIGRSVPILRSIKKLCYYLWQLIPVSLLPKKFASRHAYALIGVAKKPEPNCFKRG